MNQNSQKMPKNTKMLGKLRKAKKTKEAKGDKKNPQKRKYTKKA